MKAYQAQFKNEEWVDLIHAADAQKAKLEFWREYMNEGEFIDVRVKRVPELDLLPLTGKNIVAAGYDEDWLTIGSYICDCDLCKGAIS